MAKNNWKRFGMYETILLIFFGIGLFSEAINKELLHFMIPSKIVGYVFWLSLGLYLGFSLCKNEYSRARKLHWAKKIQTNENSISTKVSFWNKYSSGAMAGGGVAVIALLFFRSYLDGYVLHVVLFGVLAVFFLIVSEVTEYLEETPLERCWSRFVYSEKSLIILLTAIPFFDIVNSEVLNSVIPDEIELYLFCLNVGLYLGFKLCMHEYQRALNLNYEQSVKDESIDC